MRRREATKPSRPFHSSCRAIYAIVAIGVAAAACLAEPGSARAAPCDIVDLRIGAGSELDIGWSGGGHDRPISDGTTVSMAVVRRCSVAATVCLVDTDCPGGETCDPTCDCNGGPDTECELAGPVDQKRCVAAMDVPCLIDADCPPFGGTCKSTFSPPLPLSASGAPTCVTSWFDDDFTGTVDLQSGRVELATRLRLRMHIGLEVGKPCPTCGTPAQNPVVGDTFTCDGGPQDGQTCSVDAVNAIFGGTSFDCPPSPGSNISGAGLAIRLDRISTEPQSVDAGLACGGFMGGLHPGSGNAFCLDNATPCATNADCQRCTGAPTIPCTTNGDCSGNGTCAAAPEQPVACGVYCHCGFCDGDPTAPCFSDTQCGIGETCEQGTGIARQVQNNRCNDLICGLGGEERCCDASDPDCANPTPLDGECADQPYRTCTNNDDCTSEGAAGPCVLSNRPCFENRIVRAGSASPLASYCLAEPVPSTCTTNADCSVGACTPYVMQPQLDALFCSPPSSSSGVNSTYGIPGPAVLSLDATLFLDGGTACLCGNGVLECLEQCDDANNTNGDGCDVNCSVTACGNGVFTPATGEQCDDGDLTSGDGCDTNCTPSACGNGIAAGSEQCDDGNVVSGDGCDANCTPTACGNGVVTGSEQCDDGNVTNGDGCSATCEIEVPSSCSLASSCKALGAAGRAKLQIADQDDDTRDKLSWKWSKGEATDFADFGAPTATTSYLLCVFDGGDLKGEYVVPASATLWTTGSNTASYRDKAGTQAGITGIKLRAGATGSASAQVKARGGSLTLPAPASGSQFFTQSPSVTVRLVNGDGVCWEAEFPASSTMKNTVDRFVASTP